MSREQAAVSNKEPLMHISKRDGIELWKAWAIRERRCFSPLWSVP